MRRAAVTLAALVAACSGGGAAPIKLDGSVHRPTDAGLVTAADRHHLILDGTRTYSVSGNLVAFIPGTLQLAPLVGAIGRYALIGAAHGRVDWVEELAVIAALPGGAPTVFFFGTLASVAGSTATFRDGTVLTLGAGVRVTMPLPAPVRADIDPTSHVIRNLVLSAAASG